MNATSVDELKKAVTAGPRRAGLRLQLSRKLSAEGQLGDALSEGLKAFDLGVRKGVATASYWENLAHIFLKHEMPKLAEIVASHAINNGIEDPRIYFRWAQACVKQRQFDIAIKCLDRALFIDPTRKSLKIYRDKVAGMSKAARRDKKAH